MSFIYEPQLFIKAGLQWWIFYLKASQSCQRDEGTTVGVNVTFPQTQSSASSSGREGLWHCPKGAGEKEWGGTEGRQWDPGIRAKLKSMGLRGYRPWGCKESDVIELVCIHSSMWTWWGMAVGLHLWSRTSSFHISWEQVRNAHSQALPTG